MADDMMLSANDIALGSLLSGRNYGYGGAWGNGYPGHGTYAGPSANAVRLDRNAEISKESDDCTRLTLGAGLDRISAQAEEARREGQFLATVNATTNAEFRTMDRLRDIEKQLVDNAKDAAKCCCDLKIQACEDKAQILAAIAAQGTETVTRELNQANARITQLETISSIVQACGCCNGNGPGAGN